MVKEVYDVYVKICPEEEGKTIDIFFISSEEEREKGLYQCEMLDNLFLLFNSEEALKTTQKLINDFLYGTTSNWTYPFQMEVVDQGDDTEVVLNGQDVRSLACGINYAVGHMYKALQGSHNR